MSALEYQAAVLTLFGLDTEKVLDLYPPIQGDNRDVLVTVNKIIYSFLCLYIS